MVAAQVIGNDATITIAGQSGNFQLNVMLPVIALQPAAEHRSARERVRARSPTRAIAGFTVNEARLDEALERNPILVTALNPVHRLREGRGDREAGVRRGPADPRVVAEQTQMAAGRAGAAARPARADARRRQGRRRRRLTVAIAAANRHELRRLIEGGSRTRGRRPIRCWRVPAGFSADVDAAVRQYFPARPGRPAAVLRAARRSSEDGLTVLLTQRATQLKNHAGQISFPGGRIEASDEGPLRRRAARDARRRSASSRQHVTFVGYLDRSSCCSGFWVTPVVGFVQPGFALALDRSEVERRSRCRCCTSSTRPITRRASARSATTKVHVYDIPYGEHHIWGATAGMLISLYRMLNSMTVTLTMSLDHASAARSWRGCAIRSGGCPWDLEQTFATIAPYTIEEAYEVADAIERDDCAALRGRARRPAVPGRVPRADGERARRVRIRRRGRRDLRQDGAAPSARVRRRAHRQRRGADRRVGRAESARSASSAERERAGRRAAGAAGADARRQARQARRAGRLRLAGRRRRARQARRGARRAARRSSPRAAERGRRSRTSSATCCSASSTCAAT